MSKPLNTGFRDTGFRDFGNDVFPKQCISDLGMFYPGFGRGIAIRGFVPFVAVKCCVFRCD